jgi:quercetin dioxygenase-like cupin family protein
MGEPTVLRATGEQTKGHYAMAEIVSTPDGFVPLHVHHREDEAFFVLEGEVAFNIGDRTIDAGPGDFAFGPRDVPHRYAVKTPSARMLMLFSPAGFEGFIRETSEPLDAALDMSQDIDIERVLAAAARYGAEVLE